MWDVSLGTEVAVFGIAYFGFADFGGAFNSQPGKR
jgi:hypothetical protein